MTNLKKRRVAMKKRTKAPDFRSEDCRCEYLINKRINFKYIFFLELPFIDLSAVFFSPEKFSTINLKHNYVYECRVLMGKPKFLCVIKQVQQFLKIEGSNTQLRFKILIKTM